VCGERVCVESVCTGVCGVLADLTHMNHLAGRTSLLKTLCRGETGEPP
jgi:hypothetical protein